MKSHIHCARWILHLVVSLASTVVASENQTTQTAAKPKPAWTVDDMLSVESAGKWEISPDCRWAAWVKNVPDKDKNGSVGNLFLSSLTEKKEIQLTRGSDGCNSPKWSPDGQLIAFISWRPDSKTKATKAQIWLINSFGGEPWQLTGGGRPISGFQWADSDHIVYTAREEPSSYEQASQKDTSVVVEDEAHEPPVRLFKLDLKSKRVTRLIENNDRIQDFWLSPDGTRVVTVHARSLRNAYDQSLKPVTYLTVLKTGERRQIVTDADQPIWDVHWRRDGQTFYTVGPHTTNPRYEQPCIMEVWNYALATGIAEKVDLDWKRGLATGEIQVMDQGFITLLADGVRTKPARYVRVGSGWQREWISGEHTTNLLSLQIGSDDKTLLYQYSNASHPNQWYRAVLNGSKIESPVRLTSLNPDFQTKTLGKSEVIHWQGALGETVEGLLNYPHDYKSGKKYPLVVRIHGGPASVYLDQWYDENNLLNARGAFVFRANYHGSFAYGLKWAESNIGRLNELEVEDIEKGVDYLIGRGLVDPDKLGVIGWSNGGSLTAAITVATNRYKAAIAGAALIELTDGWAKSSTGGWFCGTYLGKTPLEDPMLYVRKSTFYELGRVTTPTLIFFGSEDNSVPVEQGWMYYRALQQAGKADVRFILFPGAGHGPTKLDHVRRMWEEELAWFDKYLF